MCCLGLVVVLRFLRLPDLAFPGALLSGAYVYALLAEKHSLVLSVGCAAGAGVAVGLFAGVLHFSLRLNSLLAGIVTTLAARSLMARVALAGGKGETTTLSLPDETPLDRLVGLLVSLTPGSTAAAKDGAHAVVVLVLVGLAVVFLGWFSRTRLGVMLRALGENRQLAMRSRIPVASVGCIGMGLAGGFAGVGGVLIVARSSRVTLDVAAGVLVDAYAAFLLGVGVVRLLGWDLRRPNRISLFAVALSGSFILQLVTITVQSMASKYAVVKDTDFSLLCGLIVGFVAYSTKVRGKQEQPLIVH